MTPSSRVVHIATLLRDYHSTDHGRSLTEVESGIAAEVMFNFLTDDHWVEADSDLDAALGAVRELGLILPTERQPTGAAYLELTRLCLRDLAARAARMEAARDMLREELTMMSDQLSRIR